MHNSYFCILKIFIKYNSCLLFFYLFQVYILWWTSICYWSSSLWAHLSWNHQRYCHPICSSKWVSCWEALWLGYTWPSSWIWNWQNTWHQRSRGCYENGYCQLQCRVQKDCHALRRRLGDDCQPNGTLDW